MADPLWPDLREDCLRPWPVRSFARRFEIRWWLQQLIPYIQSSSAYQSAQTVVLISWDEGSHGQKGIDCISKPKDTSCQVATLVISPYTQPGTKPSTLYTHYSPLRTTEDLLGLPHLAHAADTTTTSLRADFHI